MAEHEAKRCPCCDTEDGVQAGICIVCGWGDVEHHRGAAAIRLLTKVILPRCEADPTVSANWIAEHIREFIDEMRDGSEPPADVRERRMSEQYIPVGVLEQHSLVPSPLYRCGAEGCDWYADGGDSPPVWTQYLAHLAALAPVQDAAGALPAAVVVYLQRLVRSLYGIAGSHVMEMRHAEDKDLVRNALCRHAQMLEALLAGKPDAEVGR